MTSTNEYVRVTPMPYLLNSHRIQDPNTLPYEVRFTQDYEDELLVHDLTPLMHAVATYNIHLTKRLLAEEETNIYVKNRQGYNAMFYACSTDYVDIVKLLLEHDAKIKSADCPAIYKLYEYYDRINPLLFACKQKSENVVNYLLDLGAPVTLPDKDGLTALDWCKHLGMQKLAKRIEKIHQE
jgi:ankyrin repeat protein